MLRLLFLIMILAIPGFAKAQTTKPKSPGEIAAVSRAMAEKRADCLKQSKEKKLGFLARRRYVKACVKS